MTNGNDHTIYFVRTNYQKGETSMCFAELNGNKLTFSLPSNWKGTVDVTFTGSNKKRVDILWESGGSPINVDSCDTNPITSHHHVNAQPSTIDSEILVYYDPEACNGTPATTPATTSQQINCEDRGLEKDGSWIFECPDSGDTVGISIMIEDETVDP